MKSCPDVVAASLSAADPLERAGADDVAGHLDSCPRCRAERESLRKLEWLLAEHELSTTITVSARFGAAFEALLAAEGGPNRAEGTGARSPRSESRRRPAQPPGERRPSGDSSRVRTVRGVRSSASS